MKEYRCSASEFLTASAQTRSGALPDLLPDFLTYRSRPPPRERRSRPDEPKTTVSAPNPPNWKPLVNLRRLTRGP